MNVKYKSVIFDCDGTLIDTIEDIAGAANRALELQGYPTLPVRSYLEKVGWGIFRLAELSLPEAARGRENIEKLAPEIEKCMAEAAEGESLAKAYPGIARLLAELKSKKIKIAVMSNKPDAVLRHVMQDFFPDVAFDAVCGLRPDAAPKPDPAGTWEMLAELGQSPHETIFVGDSEIDIQTARNSGCYPLGVTWGFRSRAVLESAGAAGIIDSPDEIWDLLGKR